MKYLINYKQLKISEGFQYHIDNNISIFENIFRPQSESFYNLLTESRNLYEKGIITLLDKEDVILFEKTDIGIFDYYEGQLVPLDLPMIDNEYIEDINEAEYKGKKVSLGKPTRSSGPKKYKVYVKNPKTGKVIKVNFGDKKGGLRARTSNAKARRSYSLRHQCSSTKKKDRTKPGYWSCRLNRYKNLSGSKTTSGFW